MIIDVIQNEQAGSFSKRQQLFFRYSFFILVDFTVLGFFNQYWDLVFIESFSVALLAAVLLQVLLQITIAIEHRVANIFKDQPGVRPKVMRVLSAWAILFGSKLVILEAINMLFGSRVIFSGPIHGLVAFIFVVVGIIVAEQIFSWIYRSLA